MYNTNVSVSAATSSPEKVHSNEAFVLTLPGKVIDVSILVNKRKKFRSRGGKDGALKALEEAGMGNLVLKKSKGSVKVQTVL